MKKHLLLLTILLGFTGIITAQTSLGGKVTEEESGEAISFANVVLLQNGVFRQGVTTDLDGNYNFSNVDPGTYSVEVSYTGYPTVRIEDVSVLGGKFNSLDIVMDESTGVNLQEVIVREFRKPLIEKDNTTSGGVITSEEIYNLPTRSINAIAATTAGLSAADEGSAITIRGSRTNATNYYIDGVRVNVNLLQESEIEQLQVITGGVEARYGDVTGGIISITTKGPSNKFTGGVEVESTSLLNEFDNQLVGFYFSGPILKNRRNQSILGYRLSGRFTLNEDGAPPAVPVYQVKEEKLAELEANPLRVINGQSFVAADFLTNDDVNALNVRPNEDNQNIALTAKIDAQLSPSIDITLGGTVNINENEFTPGGWRLLNSFRNPTAYNDTYRGNFRIRHRIGGQGEQNSIIQNASYSIQFGYEKALGEDFDPRHEDNLFAYGHVGTFDIDYIPVYGEPFFDTLTGGFNLQQVDYREVLRGYDPSTSFNPIQSNYNNLLNLPMGEQLNPQVEDLAFRGQGTGGIILDDFPAINGRVNGVFGSSWNFHSNVGAVYNNFSKTDADIIIANLNGSFDLVPGGSDAGRHSIQFGFAYEERILRSYGVSPRSLWTIARQNANIHIPSVNPETADTVGFVQVDFGPLFPDSLAVLAPTVVDQPDGQFYRALRESLGVPLDQFVNVDGLDPSQLSLSMFSARELNDQGAVGYLGFDYLGNKYNGEFEDFFTARDLETGLRTFPVAPNRPLYAAAYIQDKFTFRDIIFRLGVRVDRYDANTKVLKDPYSLYDIIGAGDFHTEFGGSQPGNIGDDFAVYTATDNGTQVVAYRSGDDWFEANGTPTNGPEEIEAIRSGLVFPKYANPAAHEVANFIKDENFTVETSFDDYEPQINVMPRLAFSFPISEDANFFSHYDILVQRPATNTIATPLDYFYFVERTGSLFNNPNLRPSRTVNYEVGFQQRLSASSALKIAAYYRELRDMIQQRTFFPVPLVVQYTTYDNQDFGTVKGFSVNYDLRRTSNITVNANYTLQFADGTGSNANSQRGLTNQGNLRYLFPFDYDERHRINLVLDYRFGPDPFYNGPRFGDIPILANAGLNVQAIAVSGRPYTASLIPTEFGGIGTVGAINGARQPWNFFVNARIDKTFLVNQQMRMNVYLRVSNLLDRRNVIAVYPVTGSPEDSGFLLSRFGEDQINTIESSTREVESYLASYQWTLLNPGFFSLPRRFFIGARIDF